MGYILAIDPGREKNGVAVISPDKQVVRQAVVKTEYLLKSIEDLLTRYAVKVIVVGNRTGGKQLVQQLRTKGGVEKVPEIAVVDEDYSTEEGRRLYWLENPPRGLRRLLPTSLQTPPRPIDDYVARILAERYLERK